MILTIRLKWQILQRLQVPFLVELALGEGRMQSLGLENADFLKTACMPLVTSFYKQKQRP